MISTGQEEGSVFGPGIDNLQFSIDPSGDDQTFVRLLFSATADFFATLPFERNDRSFHEGFGGEEGSELSAMLLIEFLKNLAIMMNGLAVHSDIIYCIKYQKVKTPFFFLEGPPPEDRNNLP